MSNKVEPIDELVETLRRSCGLFNQLVSENTRLRKLESPDPPTGPCTRRVDGKWKILTADEAIAYAAAEIHEQACVVHGVEDDFLAAIRDTKRAIRRSTSLAGAIEPFVDKPAKWLAEVLHEIERMRIAALWPYPRDDDHASQTTTLAPADRMTALFAVQQRLNHLDCSLEIGLQTTPAGPDEDAADYKPGQWFTNETSIPLSRLRMAASRETKRVRTITDNGVVLYSATDARRWWPNDMVKRK